MSNPIVEQLATGGLKVQCADGAVVECQPLLLVDAMAIINANRIAYGPDRPVPPAEGEEPSPEYVAAIAKRSAARIEIVERFTALYPELAKHVSGGDVELLVPDFFWSTTGAAVVRPAATPESPSTGTTSGASTPPSGEPSPTP